jgi:hypothetical protein
MKNIFLIALATLLIVGYHPLVSNSSAFPNTDDESFKVFHEHSDRSTGVINPAEIIFHWEDDFNKKEQDKIKTWLNKTALATQQTVGNYPFDIHFYIHRSDDAREPVPWGNTERSEIQGVTFHVNPAYSLEEFLNDWTAPHEISHLAIPFPGQSNRWFSEGFATYMQEQVLINMGEFTTEQVEKKYKKKLSNCWPYYQSDSPFIVVADSLKNNHHYPEMYWGSVTFFVNLDQYLQQTEGMSLNELLQEYQLCCRANDEDLNDIIRSFDRLTNDSYPSDLLDAYRNGPARAIMPTMD